jgi:hypothetical protein
LAAGETVLRFVVDTTSAIRWSPDDSRSLRWAAEMFSSGMLRMAAQWVASPPRSHP